MGLRALEEAFDKIDEKTIFTEELWKVAEFLLKSNYFKFCLKAIISNLATKENKSLKL